MKIVLIGVSIALLALSSWLWYQLRDANASCNSMVVSSYSSQLHYARVLEEQLREGRTGDALESDGRLSEQVTAVLAAYR